MIDYYFITLLFFAVFIIIYIGFRLSLSEYLQVKFKISKTKIKKSMEGGSNYWWYTELAKKYNFKFLYFTNKLFTIIFSIGFALHLLFGWIKVISFPVAFLFMVIAILTIIMIVFSYTHGLISKFGTWMVLFEQNENKKIESILWVPFIVYLIIRMEYTQFKMFFELWN